MTAGDKKLKKLRVSILSKLELGKSRYSSKTSPFLGYAPTTIACYAAVPRCTNIASFGRATHLKKVLTTSLFPLFSTTTASVITGAFTHATERRYAALRAPHDKFVSKTKAYFQKRLPDTKVNYITEEGLFASVSVVTGAGLTRKLGTLYGSVAAVLESDPTTNGEDVNVVLGTTSNTVNRVYPAYITAIEIGLLQSGRALSQKEGPEGSGMAKNRRPGDQPA